MLLQTLMSSLPTVDAGTRKTPSKEAAEEDPTTPKSQLEEAQDYDVRRTMGAKPYAFWIPSKLNSMMG
jgi:hypothetical protein